MTKLLSIILLFIYTNLYSQRDLIVTQNGEQIRCKVIDETNSKYKFSFIGPNQMVLKSEIYKNAVKSLSFDYYEADINENFGGKKKKENKKDVVKPEVKEITENMAPEKEQKEKKTKQKKVKETAQTIPSTPVPDPNAKYAVISQGGQYQTKPAGNNDKTKNENTALVNNTPSAPSAVKTSVEEKTKLPEIKKEEKNIVPQKTETPSSKAGNKEALKTEYENTADLIKKNNLSDKIKPLPRAEEYTPIKTIITPDPVEPLRTTNMNWRIGIKGGFGLIIDPRVIPTAYGSYISRLNQGWVAGADAAYFFNKNLGLGVKFVSFNTKNSQGKLDLDNPITKEPIIGGSVQNAIQQIFIGPTLVFKGGLSKRTFLILTGSPGYNFHRDMGTVNASNYILKGKKYGANGSLGLDFMLGNEVQGRDLILSVECGLNYGIMDKLNVAGTSQIVPQGIRINLNKVDFSIGLRATRFPVLFR